MSSGNAQQRKGKPAGVQLQLLSACCIVPGGICTLQVLSLASTHTCVHCSCSQAVPDNKLSSALKHRAHLKAFDEH